MRSEKFKKGLHQINEEANDIDEESVSFNSQKSEKVDADKSCEKL